MKAAIDIISSAKKGVIYALAGTELKIISTWGHVFIVEDPKGNRFPVSKENLTGINENNINQK